MALSGILEFETKSGATFKANSTEGKVNESRRYRKR